jgi:hypothetical protein
MKSRTSNGIVCDKCHLELSNNFTYFSHDLKDITQTNMRLDYFALKHVAVAESLDLCSMCDHSIRETVIKNHEVTNQLKNDFHCDISGVPLQTVASYYHVIVTKVDVNYSNQVSKCKACGWQLTAGAQECPKCKSLNAVKRASVNSINAVYEYNLCKSNRHVVKNPQSPDSQWSAKS